MSQALRAQHPPRAQHQGSGPSGHHRGAEDVIELPKSANLPCACTDSSVGKLAGPSAEGHDAKPARVRTECGDLPFLIKRDGTWLYRGSPIGRKELVCLFSSVLKRDDAGTYWLETPAERGRIQVEDTPWIAVELDWTRCGSGRQQCLTFRTNVDQIVTAGPEHGLRVAHNALTCEPTPYIHIRAGDGAFPLEARIGRAVYYELVALAVPGCSGGKKCLGVWSSGIFFPLGDLPACDA